MRKVLSILAGAGLCAIAGSALADKYGDLVGKSTRLGQAGDVAGLFWSATVDCGKLGDDLQRRQCEGVREARADLAAEGTYLTAGDSRSFVVGDWDDKKGGVSITVIGCIACDRPVDVSGHERYLVTKGDVKVEGGAVRGPVVHKALRKFKSQEDARRWRETVVPRLKTQFVFKMPDKAAEWSAEGARGYSVEMLGFRVWDPCDGAMVCSNPPSDDERADKAACKGGAASGTDVGEVKPDVTPEPEEDPNAKLPERLGSKEIEKGMAKAKTAVNACFATYGVPGKADLSIQIGGDGTVKKVELRGEFKDTPTGQCIVEAVMGTEFPQFKANAQTIKYPFILR